MNPEQKPDQALTPLSENDVDPIKTPTTQTVVKRGQDLIKALAEHKRLERKIEESTEALEPDELEAFHYWAGYIQARTEDLEDLGQNRIISKSHKGTSQIFEQS